MATPNQMGTHHMTSHNWEPQRTNNFELQIVGLSDPASNTVTLSVANFSAPSVSVNPITVPYGNNKVKFAGTPEYGESSVTFNDFIGLDTAGILDTWFKDTYNVDDQTVGEASRYKKTAYLIEYSPDGKTSRQWQLEGCWLSNLSFGDFNQEGGSVRQVSGTLQYDYFKHA